MERLNNRKREIDALLADSATYTDENKDSLKNSLFEQATIAKELEQIETEWMQQQEALEALSI